MNCLAPVDLLSLLSCSRQTSGFAEHADGTLTEFSNNVLRITDKGLIIEEARTNTYPNSFDLINNAVAGGSSQSTGDNYGPLQGAQIISGGATWHRASGFASARTVGEKLSYTAYFKFGDSAGLIIMFGAPDGSGGTTFPNLSVSSDLSFASSPSAFWSDVNIALLSNGLYKLSAVYTVQNSGNHSMGIGPNSNVAGEYVDIYGFQEELGAFPTSLIETESVAVTRAADHVQFVDGSWLNGTRGTFLFETADIVDHTATSQGRSILYFEDGNASNTLRFGFRSGGLDGWSVPSKKSGATVFSPSDAGTPNYSQDKIAYAYEGNVGGAFAHGGAIVTNANDHRLFAAIPSKMHLGNLSGTAFLNGCIRSITYWPERKTGAELQDLTS